MDISSVNNWEYVNIVGHYNKLIYCEQVDSRLLTRGYTEDQIEMLRNQAKSSNNLEIISCNLHLKGDLDRWEYPFFDMCLLMFDAYDRHGTLPYPGTLSEQPSKIIELFDICSQLKSEHLEKARKEQEREQRKANRG